MVSEHTKKVMSARTSLDDIFDFDMDAPKSKKKKSKKDKMINSIEPDVSLNFPSSQMLDPEVSHTKKKKEQKKTFETARDIVQPTQEPVTKKHKFRETEPIVLASHQSTGKHDKRAEIPAEAAPKNKKNNGKSSVDTKVSMLLAFLLLTVISL
jgi:hypothetical protein